MFQLCNGKRMTPVVHERRPVYIVVELCLDVLRG